MMTLPRSLCEEGERLLRERLTRKRNRALTAIARMKSRMEAKAALRAGKRWSPRVNRWV